MGQARPENRKVHALRRPHFSTGPDRLQREARTPGRDQTVPRDDRDPGVRQGVPRGRPALRNPGRDVGSRTQAHGRSSGQIRRPYLRRERGGRHDRAVPLVGAFREHRVPDVRREAVSEVHRGGARGRASGRHDDRRGARRRLRLLQETRARGRGRRRSPRGVRAAPPEALHPVQLAPSGAHGLLRRVAGGAVRPRSRRQHEPLRHLSLGAVDRLRPRLDRRGGGRVRDGGSHLRLSAKGPLQPRPNSRLDGPLELLVRDGHPRRRSRSALAVVPARPERAAPFGDVRSVLVRRPLHHDPASGVSAGCPRTLGLPESAGALAAVVRCLRGVRRDAVRLPDVPQPGLRGGDAP